MGNNEKAAGSKTVMIVSSFIVGIFVILGIVMPEALKAAADVSSPGNSAGSIF